MGELVLRKYFPGYGQKKKNCRGNGSSSWMLFRVILVAPALHDLVVFGDALYRCFFLVGFLFDNKVDGA